MLKDYALANETRSNFNIKLWENIGEQKIDIVLNMLNDECDLPIYKVAREKGVHLV